MTKPEKPTKLNGLAPSRRFQRAHETWRKIDDARAKLINQIEGSKLALSLSRNQGDAGRVPEHLRQLAAPYVKEAEDDPHRLIKKLGKATRALGDLSDGPVGSAYDEYQAATRFETNRIAQLLQPRHRKAVAKMVRAAELMSEAIHDEREVLATLEESAPLAQSMYLPPLGRETGTGTLSDVDSPLWRWGQRVRELKIF